MFSIRSNIYIKWWRNQTISANFTKIKSFINKYNWEGINFTSEKYDRKNFEK